MLHYNPMSSHISKVSYKDQVMSILVSIAKASRHKDGEEMLKGNPKNSARDIGVMGGANQ